MHTAAVKFTAILVCSLWVLQGCKNAGDTNADGKKSDSASPDVFADNIRVTEFQTPEQERAAFKLPPGFEITLFASEPDISKPINMEFDERGRLWVTNTHEYPMPARGRAGGDHLTILEDTDGDGKADKFTHFEDTLNIPIGITPVHNGAIAYSIPNIYRFTDNDGDGKADAAKKLVGPFEFVDTHGMVNNLIRGWDGWIYACHGYANTSTVAGADGDSIKMMSGNTFRFKEDGSRVEATTFGRINPFGYAYDEWGYLYSLDCHTKPIYQLIPGAQYPAQGVNAPTIGWAPEMMSYEFGSTANSGLVYYTGEQFPEEYRNNFYSGNVVTSRINRNTMSLHGSSPESKREEDFITTSDPWFRPVDLKTAPDGSIYIADFYNRIIGHYEVPKEHPQRDKTSGRIWKVTYVGNKKADAKTPPKNWSKAPLDELVKGLSTPQLNTRMTIANYIVDYFGQKAVAPVKTMMEANAATKPFVQGLWILYRLNALPEALLNKALANTDPIVQVHALRVLIAQNKLSAAQYETVLAALKSASPQVQRTAVEVLGHFPKFGSITYLLAMYNETVERDTHLRYTALLAIRDNLKNTPLMQEVAKQKWDEKQLQLIIKVLPEVPTKDAASFALDYLQNHKLPPEQLGANLAYIGRYIATERLSQAITIIRKNIADDVDVQYNIYKTMRQGIASRGVKASAELQQWGVDIATKFLQNEAGASSGWGSRPIEETGDPINPWGVFDRAAVQKFPVTKSLGSERYGAGPTGIVTSPVFKLPATLSMIIFDNDINRLEEKQGLSQNAVRIRLAGSNQIVAEFRFNLEKKSRTDEEITKHSFDLSKFKDQQGYIEAVDSSKRGVVGIAEIEPALVKIPDKGPAEISARQVQAAEIIADFKTVSLEPVLKQLLNNSTADPKARSAAADALMTLSPQRNIAELKQVFARAGEYPGLKEKLALTLGQTPSPEIFTLLQNGLNGATHGLQITIAKVFASSPAGIEYLVKMAQAGKISADVLVELPVKESLAANANAKQQEQLQKIMAAAGIEDRQQIIKDRMAAYNPAAVTEDQGHQVFLTNCSMCHQIDGKGGSIGPTLSGIGSWGQKALTTKILNPNSTISEPYRSFNITMKDGKKLSGLYRRDEGAVMIFANFSGQEFSVVKADIKEKTASKYTLMPDAFSKTIAKKDFDALIKYLLSVKDKK